ncbi:MAG: hypothetical protein M0003_09440 [Acidithiobacillus sp.]|nr:hypothetical protein [Acidithiobacillus sp.]
MNEQLNVALTITNDRGEEISPLVRQEVALDGKFTNLLNTLNRLNAIKNAQAVAFNIHPVHADGSPADSSFAGPAGGMEAPFWMVSFITRRSGGMQVAQELLPFRTKALAEDFTRRLVDAFQDGRKISVSMDPPIPPQRPSAEIHQLVRPAPTGFSPGA